VNETREPRDVGHTPSTGPTAYDSFADAYNSYWGSFSLTWLKIFGVLVAGRVPRRARVLDLCCGTGQLSAELYARDYVVLGLDGSRQMLRYARSNAPGVEFVQGDARRFGLRPRQDVVLCMFDSLNHVLTVAELEAVFRSVHDCLRPGGVFLFDLNTETGYARHWRGVHRIVSGDYDVASRSVYYPRRRLGVFRASISRRDDTCAAEQRVELWQRCHDPAEVLAALAASGLVGVETFGTEGDALVPNCTEGSERAFYLCMRPRSRRAARVVPPDSESAPVRRPRVSRPPASREEAG
jgi:SAM-dependent methyltransferase